MSITSDQFNKEFVKLRDEAEAEVVKVAAEVGQFLRSTFAALAHDPAVVAAVQNGFKDALGIVLSAVETGGASILPSIVLTVAKELVTSVGGAAESSLVTIVAGELHAAAEGPTAATPEVKN